MTGNEHTSAEPLVVPLCDYKDMASEAWQRLSDASNDRSHPMRLMSLATIDHHGCPANRLLVIRGANRELGRLWFHTDRRSLKVRQLHGCDRVCAVTYDSEIQLQLCVSGTAVVHDSDELADRHWAQAALAGQYLYRTPLAPGQPLPVPDPRNASLKPGVEADDGRANFAVIEVMAEAIDWLQISGTEQRRAVMQATSGWVVAPLAP